MRRRAAAVNSVLQSGGVRTHPGQQVQALAVPFANQHIPHALSPLLQELRYSRGGRTDKGVSGACRFLLLLLVALPKFCTCKACACKARGPPCFRALQPWARWWPCCCGQRPALHMTGYTCSLFPLAYAALGQVVALLLRSSGRPGQPVPAPEAELDYPALLNRVGGTTADG